jgi:hypothetical protein|uniref:Uncharacterized protein n=1 Tax=viral metagenome TaxID=1070528 RepID=A0A6C0CF95_9ZZZZ
MEQVIQQAPANISVEDIETIFNKNNSNVNDTLTELWDIDMSSFIIEKKTTKWDEIRDTCDSFDFEMKNMIDKNRNV